MNFKFSNDSISHLSRPIACPARAKIALATGAIEWVRNVHNHRPEYDGHAAEVNTSRRTWNDAIKTNPRANPCDTLLETRRELPLEVAREILPVAHIRIKESCPML